MSKWKMVRLNKVVTLLNGRAFKQEELLKEGITPVLRVGNFFSNRDWYYSDLTLEENKYCNKGDLLYAWSASFGPMIWLGPRAIYHYHIWKIVLGNTINKNYLYYVLEYKTREIISGGHGIAMIHATKSGMENMLIPLPPLEQQRKIAATLDAATDLLKLRKQKLAELDELIESVFYDMFGDPVTNEKGWTIQYWGDIFNTTTGKLDSNAMIPNGKYPFFTCAKESFRIDNYAFDCEALLLAGNNAAGVYDVKHYKGKFNAYQRTYVIQLKDQMHSYHLYKILLKLKLEKMKHLSKGTNTRYLTLEILNDFKFIVPPYSYQNRYASIVKKIEEQKALVQQSVDETQELFDSLMSEYFDE